MLEAPGDAACPGGRADGGSAAAQRVVPPEGPPPELSELLQAVAACQAALAGLEARQATRETEAHEALRELRDAQREHGAAVAELSGALRDARPLQDGGSAAGLGAPPAVTLRPQQVQLPPTAAELLEELQRHSE